MTGLALALSPYIDPHSPLQPKALYSWGVQLDLDLRSLPGWPVSSPHLLWMWRIKSVWSMSCLYKVKLRTRRTAETTTTFNNGLTCTCFTALLRRPHRQLAIALNLDGKSCDLNNQWTVGPGTWLAAASRYRIYLPYLPNPRMSEFVFSPIVISSMILLLQNLMMQLQYTFPHSHHMILRERRGNRMGEAAKAKKPRRSRSR